MRRQADQNGNQGQAKNLAVKFVLPLQMRGRGQAATHLQKVESVGEEVPVGAVSRQGAPPLHAGILTARRRRHEAGGGGVIDYGPAVRGEQTGLEDVPVPAEGTEEC